MSEQHSNSDGGSRGTDQSLMASHGQRLLDLGYAIIPVAPGGKRPGFAANGSTVLLTGWPEWLHREIPASQVRSWAERESTGVGILCGRSKLTGRGVLVVDIDVEDPALVEEIEHLAGVHLGEPGVDPPRRVGQAPKSALWYRLEEPIRSATIGSVKGRQVEIRADTSSACQTIAYHVHPDTRQPYRWTNGELYDVPLDELPLVSADQVTAFLAEVGELLDLEGVCPESSRTPAAQRSTAAERAAPSLAAVEEAISALPNDNLPYDAWVRVGMALKGACGPGADEAGLELWRAFSAKASKNEAAVTDEKWRSFAPHTLGWPALRKMAREAGWGGSEHERGSDSRPEVALGPELHETVERAVEILAAREDSIYQRGQTLVHVLRGSNGRPHEQIKRPSAAPVIAELPCTTVQLVLSRQIRWVRSASQEEPNKQVQAPLSVAKTIHGLQHWKGVRHLRGLVEFPVFRPDGSVLIEPGYDETTGLLLCRSSPLPGLPAEPSLDDARAAVEVLRQPVAEFMFASDVHFSAWLSALLSVFVRHVEPDANFPMFLVDGPKEGCGKGKLANVISLIATGRTMTVRAQPSSDREWENLITTLALEGDQLVLIDNMKQHLEGGPLEAALTCRGAWSARRLHRNESAGGPNVPLNSLWFATSNNVTVSRDMARRIIPIRLEPLEERPDQAVFEIPRLESWVRERRPQLLTAALTILRAYVLAGRPSPPGAVGSFETWSDWSRGAVVWLGLADPDLARELFRDTADVEGEAHRELLLAWRDLNGGGPLSSGELAQMHGDENPGSEARGRLRDALQVLCPARAGCAVTPAALGQRLARLRGSVMSGLLLAKSGSRNGSPWVVVTAEGRSGR